MTRNLSGRLTTGTVIVLIGIILLLSTTGFVEMRSVWGWIAALFVLVGVWALIRSEFRNLVGPIMVIAIAGAFFLRNVGILPDGVIGTWWPLFVVLFGLLIMINRSRRRQRIRLEGHGAGEVTSVAVFGSDERRPVTERFTGGELVAVFGETSDRRRRGGERDATDDPELIVTGIALFGDIEIRD